MLYHFFDCHLMNVGKHLGMKREKKRGMRGQGEQGGTPAHGASIRCATGRRGRNRRDGREPCRWPQEGHDLREVRTWPPCRAIAQAMYMYERIAWVEWIALAVAH